MSEACVASVCVLFRSKQRPRNRILGFGCARMLRGQFDSRNSTETLATQAMMSGTLSPLGQMFGGKHRHRDVPGFTTKWNNFSPIGNSTFAPTEIFGFFS